jgi:hypothetical protein
MQIGVAKPHAVVPLPRVLIVSNVSAHGTLLQLALNDGVDLEIVAAVDETECSSSQLERLHPIALLVDASSVSAARLRGLVSAASLRIRLVVYAIDDVNEAAIAEYLELGTRGFVPRNAQFSE